MPLAYYARLGTRQKAIYRKSDAVAAVPLPDPRSLWPLVDELEQALASGERVVAQRAATRLVARICDQLGVPRVRLRVLSARPRSADSELYGLYERDEESDEPPLVKVWMRTSTKRNVVRFRTFLRTILHELCHHLDYDLLRLDDSFHTEGFFRRESSLTRQLVRAAPSRGHPVAPPEDWRLSMCEADPSRPRPRRPAPRRPRPPDPRQLALPF